MAKATNQQFQNTMDNRTRVRCEQIRALHLAILDDIATADSMYAHAVDNPTWTDQRTDGPPNLATVNDWLASNTFNHMLKDAIEGSAEYAIIRKLCVRGV